MTRWAIRAVAIVALFFGASAALAAPAGPSPSQPLSGRVPGVASGGTQSEAGAHYQIVIEPSLSAGAPGWTSSIFYTLQGMGSGGSGGGGGYPTQKWPFIGTVLNFSSGGSAPRGDVVDYFLTGPDVAAVRFGKQTISTFTSPLLPTGDRAVVFFRRAAAAPVIPAMGLRPPGRSLRLFALDAAGHVIALKLAPGYEQRVRFWQAPSAITPSIHEPRYHGATRPLPGGCELGQHGLPGLTPEWGHVIRRIVPVSGSQGEVFLSCVDTEYYFHGWPLEVAVLLDAANPGQTLGAIPGATPVPGDPNTVNLVAGQFPGSITARQIGMAWLAVEGGASLTQRLRVLGALEIKKLELP